MWRFLATAANLFFLPSSCLSLTVYFDGSLRAPIDPTFPTGNQRRRAACAALVQWTSDDSVESFSFGGRMLECNSYTTSAEVEYEGLLLGLEGLWNVLERMRHQQPDSFLQTMSHPVRVRGDCKTVLGQMNGKSRPRKLEAYFHQAWSWVNRIQQLELDSDPKKKRLVLAFEHVPRSHNTICDGLCTFILQQQQHVDETRAWEALPSVRQDYLTLESNAIRYSKRPAVYRALVRHKADDWEALIWLGQTWYHEVTSVWPDVPLRQKLQQEALHTWRRGLEGAGRAHEARRLEKKYRSVLLLKNPNLTPDDDNDDNQIDPAASAPEWMGITNNNTGMIHKWMTAAQDAAFWDIHKDDKNHFWMTNTC